MTQHSQDSTLVTMHLANQINSNNVNSNSNTDIKKSLNKVEDQVPLSDITTTSTYKNATAVSNSLSQNTKIRSSGQIGKEKPKNNSEIDTVYDMQQTL